MEQNYRYCKRCDKRYNTSPFESMLSNGERSDSVIEIYGQRYNLCPECTYNLWQFVCKREHIK